MTLVELLVAMAILVTVTGSTMLIFRGITQAWRSGQLKTDRYQQARLIFDLFARELSSCVANPRFPFVGLEAAQGVQLKAASAQDAVFFIGSLPGRAGLVERGYWVDAGGRLMCHDQEPADGDYAATGTDEPCGREIVQFDVTYFDGAEWLSQWDGRTGAPQAGRIPKAVKIRLTIGEDHGESFETVIRIPTS
ncbi:MAG: hypothetical protein HYY91_03415 [Candidatus Omnitrophica bacterium]|nr:hypothetical protein [Candidatus Omnitrophota bacterium]